MSVFLANGWMEARREMVRVRADGVGSLALIVALPRTADASAALRAHRTELADRLWQDHLPTHTLAYEVRDLTAFRVLLLQPTDDHVDAVYNHVAALDVAIHDRIRGGRSDRGDAGHVRHL